MPVVGSTDEDSVYILSIQNLAIIAISCDVLAIDFLSMRTAARISVGYGHKLYAGNLQGCVGVAKADDAPADGNDTNLLVRTFGSSRERTPGKLCDWPGLSKR